MSAVGVAIVLGFLFFIIGAGFHLGSLGSAHFAFAVGAAFPAAPLIARSLIDAGWWWVVAVVLALLCCCVVGGGYWALAWMLHDRSASDSHLLVVALASMGILESLLSLGFGSQLRDLPLSPAMAAWLGGSGSRAQWLAVGLTAALVSGALIWQWHNSRFGLFLRALSDSREVLEIRGVSSRIVSLTATTLGFGVAGLGGVLWCVVLQVRAASAMDAGVIGVVVVLVGGLIADGLFGILLASLACAGTRFAFSWYLSGDWTLSSMFVVLVGAFLVRKLMTEFGAQRG